jgi:hypothetical protein
MAFLLFLQLVQIFVEAVKAPVPGRAGLLNPACDLIQLLQASLTVTFTPLLLNNNKSTLGKDLDMPGDCRTANGKVFGYITGGESLSGQ